MNAQEAISHKLAFIKLLAAKVQGELKLESVKYEMAQDDLAPTPYAVARPIGDSQRINLALDCVFTVDRLDHANAELERLRIRYEEQCRQIESQIRDLRAEKDRLMRAVKYCVVETENGEARAASAPTSLVTPSKGLPRSDTD